jgi:hypothetical protein
MFCVSPACWADIAESISDPEGRVTMWRTLIMTGPVHPRAVTAASSPRTLENPASILRDTGRSLSTSEPTTWHRGVGHRLPVGLSSDGSAPTVRCMANSTARHDKGLGRHALPMPAKALIGGRETGSLIASQITEGDQKCAYCDGWVEKSRLN